VIRFAVVTPTAGHGPHVLAVLYRKRRTPESLGEAHDSVVERRAVELVDVLKQVKQPHAFPGQLRIVEKQAAGRQVAGVTFNEQKVAQIFCHDVE
jgi:hypothetical protein